MSNTKGVSVKAKAQAQTASMEETRIDFNDQLAVAPGLLAELKEKGLAHRWINGIKFKANYGYDARRWQPYKAEKTNGLENNSFGYTDSEGFIRRGDLILAVRPMHIHEQYKQNLADKNARLAGSQRKSAVEDMKQSFKEAGYSDKSKIIEGYEENE